MRFTDKVRAVLGINREVPRNDSSFGVLLFTFATGAVLVSTGVWNGLGSYYAIPIALGFVLFHGLCQLVYNLHNIYYDPLKCRLDQQGAPGVRRCGEWAGAFFFMCSLIGVLLYSFSVFEVYSDAFEWLAEITVMSLAASSVAKIIRSKDCGGEKRRVKYNLILLALCVITTVVGFILFTNEAVGKREVPAEFVLIYGTLLIAYATHNVVLAVVCPQKEQRNFGHLAAYSVAVFYLVISLLYLAGRVEFSLLLFVFAGITVLVLWVSTDLHFLLKNHKDNNPKDDEGKPSLR